MKYTEAQIGAFVMEALERLQGPTVPVLESEAEIYEISAMQLGKALVELRNANWIEYLNYRYLITIQGRLCKGMLPSFAANCESFDLNEIEQAFFDVEVLPSQIDEVLVSPGQIRVQFEDKFGAAIAVYSEGNSPIIFRGEKA